MDSLGNKLRIQRLTKNYTQEYMAFALDISQAAYSKIERDETELSWRRVFAIAEILEISPYVLMPKPKFGTGINVHSVLNTINKIKRIWSQGLKLKKGSASGYITIYSDKSKNSCN